MRNFLDPSLLTPMLGVKAVWDRVDGRTDDITVIWSNDPLDDLSFHESRPEVEVHDSFARDIASGHYLWIEMVEYEVTSVSPPDSEGYFRVRLLKHGKSEETV